MFTDVQIINLGLSKHGQSRISRIDPPVSSLERFCAAGYLHWKRSELAKRRWVFATEEHYKLTLTDTLTGDVDKPYKYALPPDALKPIRQARTEWRQAGRYLYSVSDELYIKFIKSVPEAEFDPLFVEVLAARIALETVEYGTQSNSKKADMATMYDSAVRDASQANAFVIGPEDIGSDDNDFPFLTARYN